MLYEMNRRAEYGEDVLQKYPSLIDIEQFNIREKLMPETGSGSRTSSFR